MLVLTSRPMAMTQHGLKTAAAGGYALQMLNGCCVQDGVGVVQIALGYDHQVDPWAGRFEVVARATWSIGTVSHTIELDVPARGTVFTVGVADSIAVSVVAEGDSLDAEAVVRATAGLVCTGHPRSAHRTLTHTDDSVRVIPAYARAFRMAADDVLAMATIEILAERSGALLVLDEVLFDPLRPYPLLAGADAVRVVGATATIRTIWELAP